METEPSIASQGFCIGCGYRLRELRAGATGYRCPECGRGFDPANPKTFSKFPRGRFARWAARPIEWTVVILSIVAAVGVMSVSRWKLASFAPSTVDLIYYLRPAALWRRTSLITWRDSVFTLSMLLAAFICSWWMMRLVIGLFHRSPTEFPENEKPVHTGRRHALLAMGLIVTAGGAALGWPYRLAQNWVGRQLAASVSSAPSGQPTTLVPPPIHISSDEGRAIHRAAVIQLPRAELRMVGLKLLMEDDPKIALPILTEAVERESDSDVRAMELRLIGLHRDLNTIDLLLGFVTHPDPITRAAAADALGFLHRPTFSFPMFDRGFLSSSVAATDGSTPINLFPFVILHEKNQTVWPPPPIDEITPLSGNVRDALERMMLTGSSTEEREAAARALVAWPPAEYKLRVAEWGVWINDKGELKLIQSVMDEIPAFVHRTGNPLAEFNSRINHIMMTTKPILHLTVDRPMAVDVNVVINQGRTWFAYPRPDDFAVTVDTQYLDQSYWNRAKPARPPPPPPLAPLDNPAIESLPDLRQGYPWLTPKHPSAGPLGAGGFAPSRNELSGLGLRWQSLIVSPNRQAWMTLPDVGTDPRYAWWTRLRDVPSGWISSRGESERFLYYDGPTLEPTPVAASLDHNELQLTLAKERADALAPKYGSAAGSEPPPQAALLIHHRNGRLSGQSIAMPAKWNDARTTVNYTLPQDDLQQDQAIATFRGMLTAAGLTPEESDGLIASWQTQFFHTDGTRLLLIMSRQDYDRLCPIDIRPRPTELARVGILLTELK
jgi:hypothetical protein